VATRSSDDISNYRRFMGGDGSTGGGWRCGGAVSGGGAASATGEARGSDMLKKRRRLVLEIEDDRPAHALERG
jgi:hypothetical protein